MTFFPPDWGMLRRSRRVLIFLRTQAVRQECATLSLYTTSRTTDTAQMLSFAGYQNSTALTSLHCSIRSRVEVNFVDVCGFDASRSSPELQQVRLPVRFSRRRLRFSLRTHTSVLLYSDTVRWPGDNSVRLGRTDVSTQNFTTTNARSMSYRYTGVILYQALRSLTATVKAIVVWNSWSRRYPPQMRENLLPVRIIRRQKATTREDTCTNHPVCCIVGSALGLE